MQLLENKIMRIVEERGYMGTRYIPVINEIISYTQNYILNNKFSHENKWEFFIPINITDKIDCVEDLQIKMIIEDNYRGGNNSGGGSNDVFLSNTIRNGKLSLGNIKIYGYSYKENIPDVRNTRVIELYEELKKRNYNVNICDNIVEPSLCKHKINNKDINDNDVIILAVPHEKYSKWETKEILKKYKDNSKYKIFIDIKSKYKNLKNIKEINYWNL